MRKQILKDFTMLTLIVSVAFMTAVTSANGQSPTTVIADIPFAFTVGDKTLPAGEYRVRAMTASGDALAIGSRDDSVVRLSNSIETSKAPEQAKLVFHRYGQRYFLSEVWSAGDTTGRKLLKSNEERAIEGQLASIFLKSELARSAYEVVEIVAMVR